MKYSVNRAMVLQRRIAGEKKYSGTLRNKREVTNRAISNEIEWKKRDI